MVLDSGFKPTKAIFVTFRNNITIHLNNILEHELDINSVCKDFLHTIEDGKNYKTKYYNWMPLFQLGLKLIVKGQ